MKERKAIVVHYDPQARGADPVAELNGLLADGWTIVSVSALGGAAVGPGVTGPEFHFAALAVVEREEENKSVRGFS